MIRKSFSFIISLGQSYIRSGNKSYRRIVCTPMGTNCAPFVADLFLFCYENISRKVFLMITRPILLRHSTERLDIKTIFVIA